MAEHTSADVDRKEKINALLDVARYRPKFVVLVIILGIVVAILEGVGLTFIIPIIELVQAKDPISEADGLMAVFLTIYQSLGIPFTLGFVIAGVTVIMIFRYTGSFLYNWLRRVLRYSYQRHLQKRAFDSALEARMEYFDEEGSDRILNAIITEASASARAIDRIIKLFNLLLLTLVYLLIALWISPLLTLIAVTILGSITFVIRNVVNPGYDLGDRVADANERRHEAAQAGMIGIRDIRIYNFRREIHQKFVDAVNKYTRNKIKLKRNEAAISQFYNLSVSVFVFALIYVALMFTDISFGQFGLFLFAMFQLGPKVSGLNKRFYSLENDLPHLVRTQRFIRKLERMKEPDEGNYPVPAEIESIEFDDVSFSYGEEEMVLRGIDFSIQKGEFVAFVGQSGAGKSTIVSLLARYYELDGGRICANNIPIDEFHPEEWRDRLAVVRQSPYIFNNTLRYNLTIGNQDANQREIERACKIARVDEFLDELPNGYDSQLGDEGVRLSGGQKQRVALARALLKDAEVLILDEATSDLDSNLERQVQQEIEEMDREYAIVAIAHRLSTVENADRIHTMENGKITERGRHRELLANGGKYSELYAIQSEA